MFREVGARATTTTWIALAAVLDTTGFAVFFHELEPFKALAGVARVNSPNTSINAKTICTTRCANTVVNIDTTGRR
jgi:hypothetical protein